MSFLKWLFRKWLPIAQAIGNFQAQLILTLFYLILMAPLGFIYRFFVDVLRLRSGQALMIKKRSSSSNFQKWEHSKETLEEARRQY